MRDYTCEGTPVALMSDVDIAECLNGGVEILDGSDESVADVMDRLELEVFIRAGGLRAEVAT